LAKISVCCTMVREALLPEYSTWPHRAREVDRELRVGTHGAATRAPR
jgi:hypothetical protein